MINLAAAQINRGLSPIFPASMESARYAYWIPAFAGMTDYPGQSISPVIPAQAGIQPMRISARYAC